MLLLSRRGPALPHRPLLLTVCCSAPFFLSETARPTKENVKAWARGQFYVPIANRLTIAEHVAPEVLHLGINNFNLLFELAQGMLNQLQQVKSHTDPEVKRSEEVLVRANPPRRLHEEAARHQVSPVCNHSHN